MSNFGGGAATPGTPKGLIQKLQSIQIGGSSSAPKMKKRDLIFIFRNISILVENGLSLQKALETLVHEKSLRKYAEMLHDIRQSVETGETFSDALARYPKTFDTLLVHQVRRLTWIYTARTLS